MYSSSGDFTLSGNSTYSEGGEPDDHLIDRFCRNGDLEILGVLYSRYMHLVYGVCIRYFHDRERAKDAVMQIFEKLISEIPAHRIQKFKSWLYVLTKNYCLMEIRADKTHDRKMEQWVTRQKYTMEMHEDLHPIEKEDALEDAALLECIENLKNEQKECIRLFFFENKSYREIALELELEEKKVKSNLQNGKRNLKICLEGKNAGR